MNRNPDKLQRLMILEDVAREQVYHGGRKLRRSEIKEMERLFRWWNCRMAQRKMVRK